MKFFTTSSFLLAAGVFRLEAVDANYSCALPADAYKFSVITKGDATIEAHSVYTGVAIGGEFKKYSTSSSTVDGDAYIKTLSGSAINWNGQTKRVGCDLSEAIDFGHFEWLAQHAEDSDVNGYKIIVKTTGGTFTTYDFRNGGQGEDNGKTLVIFNTSDDITLTKTNDGRQFGPSIIAPFSLVKLQGQAGYLDGFVVAKEFNSNLGSNPSNLQLHGDTYDGTISCVAADPTPNPTPSPTPGPTPSPTTQEPTHEPTSGPTPGPTGGPSAGPSAGPTAGPTPGPTAGPSTPSPVPAVCPDYFDVGIGGSEFSSVCDHDGAWLISTFPKADSTNNSNNHWPVMTAVPSIYDMFFGIDVGTNHRRVKFRVQNPFEGKLDMYIRYDESYEVEGLFRGIAREHTCRASHDTDKCGPAMDGDDIFEAVCIDPKHSPPYAIIDVIFVDRDSTLFSMADKTTISKCCEPNGFPEGSSQISYTFAMACTCPSKTYSRNLRAKAAGSVRH